MSSTAELERRVTGDNEDVGKAEAATKLHDASFSDDKENAGPVAAYSATSSRDLEAGGTLKGAEELSAAGEAEDGGKTNWALAVIFAICGTAHLFYWNALLNMIFDITAAHFQSYPNLSDTMTAFYGTFNFIGVVIMSWRGNLNFFVILSAGFLLAAVTILTPVFCIYVGERTGMFMLHVMASLAGLSTGLYQGGGYAIAGSMPGNMVSWVSTGNGIAGILTFILWMIFSLAAFPDNIDNSLWVTCAIGSAVVLFSTLALWIMKERKDVKAKLHQMHMDTRAERSDPNRMRYIEVFKQVWRGLMCIFITFFITLFIFPNIGPLRWPSKDGTQTNVTLGMFQVGDLLGRYTPTLAGVFPWVLFNMKWCMIMSWARVIFIMIFILLWKIGSEAASNIGLQVVMMLAMAYTNGWFATNAMAQNPTLIKDPKYRGRAAALGVASLMLGLTLGLWMAKVATLGS